MLTATAVDATVEGFPSPSPPQHSIKTDYAAIKEIHQLLTVNVASIECNLGGGQNGYFDLIIPPEQYAHVSRTIFVLPLDPDCTVPVPAWTLPTEENWIPRENAEQI